MSRMKAVIGLLALSVSYSVVIACHDANAGSGISQAEFDAAVARIETLEAQQQRVLAAGNAALTGVQAKALELAAVGTFLSFDGPPSVATTVNVRSDNGYLFALSLSDGELQGPGGNIGGIVRYDSTDCTGSAYVGDGDISEYAARQGTVFRIEQQDGSDVFYSVIAGTAALESATYHSYYAWGTGCTTQDADLPAYPLSENDPAVTGVGNEAVAAATVG